MATAYNVIDGQVVPDVSALDGPAALARKREVERLLGVTKGDPSRAAEREALKAENETLSARLTEVREQTKRENTRRNFAGLGSPLHEAVVARLEARVVAEIEQDALRRLDERERIANERRAKKGT